MLPRGAVVVLEQEVLNRACEWKRYEDSGRAEWPLCVHQRVTMAGSGRELAELEEVALYKDLKAGQM